MFKDKFKKLFGKKEKEGEDVTETTSNKKKVENIVVFLILLIVTLIVINVIWNDDNNNENTQNIIFKKPSTEVTTDIEPATYTVTEDSSKFKQEYEKLNNLSVNNGEEKYSEVSVPEANPIEYIDLEELVNIINSDEKSYIYISSPTCTYCRASVETMLKVVQNLGIQKVYYYDVNINNIETDENLRTQLLDQLVEKEIIKRNSQGNEIWIMPQMLKVQSGNVISKKVGLSRNFV